MKKNIVLLAVFSCLSFSLFAKDIKGNLFPSEDQPYNVQLINGQFFEVYIKDDLYIRVGAEIWNKKTLAFMVHIENKTSNVIRIFPIDSYVTYGPKAKRVQIMPWKQAIEDLVLNGISGDAKNRLFNDCSQGTLKSNDLLPGNIYSGFMWTMLEKSNLYIFTLVVGERSIDFPFVPLNELKNPPREIE
jgi:hypothetical protein